MNRKLLIACLVTLAALVGLVAFDGPRLEAQTDPFALWTPGLTTPASNAFAITPNDGANLAYTTRGLYCGGAGNVKVVTKGGETVTFTALAVGVIHPLRVTKVFATDTTATSCVGVY